MKQTAVEWLCEQYHLKQDIEIVKQAKEMEKQQRGYSEEEVIELLQKALTHKDDGEIGSLVTAQGEIRTANFHSWFNKLKTNKIMKQETLEEAAKKYANKIINGFQEQHIQENLEEYIENYNKLSNGVFKTYVGGYIDGAKWQQERSYSEEEVAIAFDEGQAYSVTGKLVDGKEWVKTHKKEWFKQFKKK